MKGPDIPFKILALAPFLGPDCPAWGKAPLPVEPSNLDQVMEQLNPACAVSVFGDLHPDERIELTFSRIKDFHPDGLVQNNPTLRNLWEAKSWVEEAGKQNLSPQEINARLEGWPNLPPVRVEPAPENHALLPKIPWIRFSIWWRCRRSNQALHRKVRMSHDRLKAS